MKIETLEINGNVYEVRELTLEEGMPLLAKADGNIDMAALVRAATKINGNAAQPGDISMSVGARLVPIVMKLNSFSGEAPGNE